MSSPPDPAKPVLRPTAIQINGWYRAAAIVLGLAGLGSGAAAVYITNLEAGPVALLVTGLILLLVGMGGRMPSRIKIGDNEAAWEAAQVAMQEFVGVVASTTPEEQQPGLLAALSDLAEVAPHVASVGINAVAYEQLVVSMVYDTFTRVPEIVGSVGVGEPDLRYDMRVETPDRYIAIEIKASSRNLPAVTVRQVVAMLEAISESLPKHVVALLVTRTQLTVEARQVLDSRPDVYVAVVEGAQDRGKLQEALRAAALGHQEIRYWA